jgi:FlaA1/EpsC-like NDP-sugar epimerase
MSRDSSDNGRASPDEEGVDATLALIGRQRPLFREDIRAHEGELREEIRKSRFLVVGGAGSIGQAVVRELFRRNPRALHVVDLSENNLVELVRDLRSSLGYETEDFQALPLDCASSEYDAFVRSQPRYDYVLNLSALKHVRSEKDPFTLMRMVQVNILNSERLTRQIAGGRKFFCVSTDKAANPVNMMGASKRIMEMFVSRVSRDVPVSMSRFANVAFSDGSLLHGFTLRVLKQQPISAPRDVRRYFVTQRESGEMCLLSCVLGENGDLFFPKMNAGLHLITFSDIAARYLEGLGYEPVVCETEEEARGRMRELIIHRKWPCHFFVSDTTGEKDYEEFYTEAEAPILDRYQDIGVLRTRLSIDSAKLDVFTASIAALRERGSWSKDEIIELFRMLLPEFSLKETHKYLDQKM